MARRDLAVAVFVLSVLSLAAPAQTTRAATRPQAAKDPLSAMALPAPPEGVIAAKQPVVTVGRDRLEADDLAREIVALHWGRAVDKLVWRKTLELECARRKAKIAEVDIDREAVRLLGMADPQAQWAQLLMTNPHTAADLRDQARDSLAMGVVSRPPGSEDEGEPGAHGDSVRGLGARMALEGYKVRKRSAGDPLAVGIAADVTGPDGKIDAVLDKTVVEYLRATLRYDELVAAREALIDDWLLGSELVAIGQSVSEDDVAKTVSAITEKHKPPFDWKMICQFKGTTPEKETAMFRRLAAWKKITAFSARPEDLLEFAKAREGHYRGENRQVAQVLFQTIDPLTGTPLDSGAQSQAEADAKAAHEKLVRGADIADFADHAGQSGSSGYAPTGPPLVTFKRYGGEQALVDAVFALTPENPLSKPVKGAKGWYVFKLQRANPPNPKVGLAEFAAPAYADWITDDYQRGKLAEYLAGLRRKHEVKPGSDTTLTSGW